MRVLFRRMDNSEVRGRSQERRVQRPAAYRAYIHTVEESKTGQIGGLPYNVCCHAPDLRIERRVLNG